MCELLSIYRYFWPGTQVPSFFFSPLFNSAAPPGSEGQFLVACPEHDRGQATCLGRDEQLGIFLFLVMNLLPFMVCKSRILFKLGSK